MKCFIHRKEEAIGVCSVCFRSVCEKCIAQDNPIVCKSCAARSEPRFREEDMRWRGTEASGERFREEDMRWGGTEASGERFREEEMERKETEADARGKKFRTGWPEGGGGGGGGRGGAGGPQDLGPKGKSVGHGPRPMGFSQSPSPESPKTGFLSALGRGIRSGVFGRQEPPRQGPSGHTVPSGHMTQRPVRYSFRPESVSDQISFDIVTPVAIFGMLSGLLLGVPFLAGLFFVIIPLAVMFCLAYIQTESDYKWVGKKKGVFVGALTGLIAVIVSFIVWITATAFFGSTVGPLFAKIVGTGFIGNLLATMLSANTSITTNLILLRLELTVGLYVSFGALFGYVFAKRHR